MSILASYQGVSLKADYQFDDQSGIDVNLRLAFFLFTLSLSGDFCWRNPWGGILFNLTPPPPPPLEHFLPKQRALTPAAVDHCQHEYEGKDFSQSGSSSVATRSQRGQVIAKRGPEKKAFFKMLKACEKLTQIMSNCLGKCEICKK